MGRHKKNRIRLSTDENQVLSTASKDTNGSVEAVFMKYGGCDTCSRCYFAGDDYKCKQVKCRPEERKDGLSGYFRAANVVKVEQQTSVFCLNY